MDFLEQQDLEKFVNFLLKSTFIGLSTACLLPLPGLAQLTPDNSLGAESSIVNPDASIDGLPTTLIEGGAARGSNLFHSFQEFNVKTGQQVYFANPVEIENILTRVTGDNLSNIDGLLGVNGAANLFLLNPNGVVFGPNATLDISGSFLTSTGTHFTFADGSEFSAIPTGEELLSVSVPIGVQFNNPQGDITSTGILETERDLTLIGNDITLEGQLLAGKKLMLQGSGTVQIRDGIDQSFIAASGGDLLIQGNDAVDIFALNHPNSGLFTYGNLTLRSANPVLGDAHYFAGADFRIEDLNNQLGNLKSSNAPVIRTLGNVSFGSYQGASLHIIAGGSVTVTGNIDIDSVDPEFGLQETVALSNGEIVEIDGKNTSTLDIRAGVSTAFIQSITEIPNLPSSTPNPPIITNSTERADIIIGEFDEQAGFFEIARNFNYISAGVGGVVFLSNQYQPNDELTGNIKVAAGIGAGSVILDSRSDISGGRLTGGRSDIEASFINTSSWYGGDAGDVTLIAGGLIGFDFDIAKIFDEDASLWPYATPFINTSTKLGTAGSIQLTAGAGIFFDGPLTVNTSVLADLFGDRPVQGSGGDIEINTADFRLTEGAQFIANTFSLGNAGNIKINANSVEFDGTRNTILVFDDDPFLGFIRRENLDTRIASGVFSQVAPSAVGNAGDIEINTRLLEVSNGAQISTVTNGRGAPGNILINASEAVLFEGVSEDTANIGSANITGGFASKEELTVFAPSGAFSSVRLGAIVEAEDRDNTGNVTINTPSLSVLEGARLTSSTSGLGNAGNVTINADTITMRGGGPNQTTPGAPDDFSGGISILVQTDPALEQTVSGGNVRIATGTLDVSDGIVIASLTRGQGDAGNVSIQALNTVSFDNSFILSEVQTQGIGAGGDIRITVPALSLANGAQFRTNTSGQGPAGTIEILASDNITLTGEGTGFIASTEDVVIGGVSFREIGDAGDLFSSAQGLDTPGTFVLRISGELSGAEDVDLYRLVLEGDRTFSASTLDETMVDTRLFLFDEVGIGVYANDNPDGFIATNLNIRQSILEAGNDLTPSEGGVYYLAIVATYGEPQSVNGPIFPSLFNGQNAPGQPGGNSPLSSWDVSSEELRDSRGNIIDGSYTIQLTGIDQLPGISAPGEAGGTIRLLSPTVSASNGAQIAATTSGQGPAGNLEIQTNLLNVSTGAELTSTTTGSGDAGLISVQPYQNGPTLNIYVGDDSTISSSTLPGDDSQDGSEVTGNSGRIIFRAPTAITLSGVGDVKVETETAGNAGALEMIAPQITLDGIEVSASTEFPEWLSANQQAALIANRTSGQGGDIDIDTTLLTLLNRSEITAATSSAGDGGSFSIASPTDELTIRGNGSINVNTENVGSAGSLEIEEVSTVTIDGVTLSASTMGAGPGGNVELDPATIRFANGGQIAASTSGSGNGGNVIFNLPGNSLLIAGDGEISVATSGTGAAGAFADGRSFNNGDRLLAVPDITIDGALLTASTTGPQSGGDVNIRTSRLTFANSGAIAASTSGSGDGGSLTITGNSPLTLRGNGRLTVASSGATSGRAGDLNVSASTLSLRDGVELSVNSASSAGGGNINLTVDGNMFVTGNSFINATSTNPSAGDGGNVNISLSNGFLIGAPGQDNDLIANAVGGNGGNINISALRLFGFSLQDEPNVDVLRGNRTNDISASSEVGLPGSIALDTLDLDPSQGLTELPVDLQDRANQITPGCGLGSTDDGSEFIVTGRGGLPPNPNDPIAANGVHVPWVEGDEAAPSAPLVQPSSGDEESPLVEAQGIGFDREGNAYFVTEAATGLMAHAGAIAPKPCEISATP